MSQLSKEEKQKIVDWALKNADDENRWEGLIVAAKFGYQLAEAHLSAVIKEKDDDIKFRIEQNEIQAKCIREKNGQLQSQAKRIEEMTELLRESRSLIDRTQYVIDRLLNKPS